MARRAKRKAPARRGTRAGGTPAFIWFGSGLLIGLGLAVLLYTQGFLPERRAGTEASADLQAPGEPGLLDDGGEVLADTPESRFDFFTVLPEMEVVVPERELSSRAIPEEGQQTGGSAEQFILQAGSFRSAADADQMKARLALMGSVASIQAVKVDNQTWHRVRIGPVEGARRADELRRQLQDNGIEVLVLRVSS